MIPDASHDLAPAHGAALAGAAMHGANLQGADLHGANPSDAHVLLGGGLPSIFSNKLARRAE